MYSRKGFKIVRNNLGNVMVAAVRFESADCYPILLAQTGWKMRQGSGVSNYSHGVIQLTLL